MTLWWRSVWCPYCGASPGARCVTVSGRPTFAHAARLRDGEYWAMEGWDDDEYDDDDEYVSVAMAPRGMITVYLPGDGPCLEDLSADVGEVRK